MPFEIPEQVECLHNCADIVYSSLDQITLYKIVAFRQIVVNCTQRAILTIVVKNCVRFWKKRDLNVDTAITGMLTGIRNYSRRMKKRFLLCFFCALTLFILMISIDNDFIYHTCQYANICEMDDITCYEETTASNDLPDFDPELGTFVKIS